MLDLNYGGDMIFDNWLEHEYQLEFSEDESLNKIVIAEKEKYLLELVMRGWKPYAVIRLGHDVWMRLGKINRESPYDISPAVIKWCSENCKGRWEARNPVWWEMEFEDDALAFKLVWG